MMNTTTQVSRDERSAAQPVRLGTAGDHLAQTEPLSYWQIVWSQLRRDRLTMTAIAVLLLIALLSLLAGPISEHLLNVDPNKTDLLKTFARPSREHLLGTDALGRDQLARLLFGGRISLAIGFLGTIFTLILGIGIGVTAAYFSGRVDDLIIWSINTLDSIPGLFLLLVIGALFEISPFTLTIVFALLGWPFISRLVRSSAYSMKEREFVLAARSYGATDVSIMRRHIIPNIFPIVIIATARSVGNLILAESALSFLGFGVQPPISTWGNMLTRAQQFILVPDNRHLVFAPGFMIALTVLCLFIIGDGLRDAMDPRLR
jgi:peptide/nickel transport system permease protein